MKVGIVSDSPALTTGYGIVTDQCCRALLDAGHQVRCFGFKDCASNRELQNYPCPIEPIDPFERWHPKLRSFVTATALDVLWIYMDMYNLEEVMAALGDTPVPPLSLYAIFDGLPVYSRLLDMLHSFRTIMVTTSAAAAYLKGEGHAVHAIAPPGVDPAVFQPLDRSGLRREAGLDDAFVIGAFGRNTERKQQSRLLLALRDFSAYTDARNVFVYFHCAQRGYWDLDDLANRWRVRERTIFADDLLDETHGVPLRRHEAGTRPRRPRIPPSFGYVERLNLCDLVINVPHSGDFEQVFIEAPACGVPVAGTQDAAIMQEALGPGWPLAAAERTLGNSGQFLHLVAVDAIEEAIRMFVSDTERRRSIAEAGISYAASHCWQRLRGAVVSALETAVRG